MPKSSRRTIIKPDWQPTPDDVEFAAKYGVDHTMEALRFHNYHLANGTLMLCWHAAWRTWVLNQVQFGRASGQRALPLLAIMQTPDPTDPWGCKAWASRLQDARPDKMPDGTVSMCVGGFDAAATAGECCQAVGLDPAWRGPLDLIADWLRAGITPEAIVAAIRTTTRPRKPEAWAYYDHKIRSAASGQAQAYG